MSSSKNLFVSISYSQDNLDHKRWVSKLAQTLKNEGFKVLVDIFNLHGGEDINEFMENVIIHSDKVLIIMTQGYKEKADKRFAGAGYEAKLIANLIKENQHTRKFIPIKRDKDDCIPNFLKPLVFIDMSDDNLFNEKIEDLLLAISGSDSDYDDLIREINYQIDSLQPYEEYYGDPIPLIEQKKYQLSLKVQNAQSEHNFLEVIKYKIQIAQICQEQNKSQDAYMLEDGIRKAYAMLSDFEKVQAKSIIADYNSDMALYIDQDINRNK